MTVYVMRGGKLMDKSCHVARETAKLHIISDIMDPTWHPCTGEMIDSKHKFRQVTKASGGIEIGNERPKPPQPVRLDQRQRRDDIRRAIYQLRNK